MTNGAPSPQVQPLKAGLEDVIVSSSEICFIDGHKGRLLYRGYDVDDLVAHSTFEEVVYLLFYGKLPTQKELDAHNKALASTANRKLPPKLVAMLKLFPKKTTPMEILRTGVSALSAFDPDAADNSREGTLHKAMTLRVVDRAMQVHGGGGVSQEFGLASAWAHSRTLRFADGPDEVHRRQIGRLELRRHV